MSIDYAWVDRRLNSYMAQFDLSDLPYYLKQVEEHRAKGWMGKDNIIVTMTPRAIGFRLRIIWGWPGETSFWPKKLRHGQGLELFGMLFQLNKETHEFMDTVYLDPNAEWPRGTKVEEIQKRLKARKVPK